MRLVFSNADEDTVDRYRDLLPRAAAAWAARRPGPAASRRALRTVVAFKLGEEDRGGDGLVARWTADDVAALLEGWVPARRQSNAADARDVPHALRTWWAFLRDHGWLDPRSAPREELERAVPAVAPESGATPGGGGRCTAGRRARTLCPPGAAARPRSERAGLPASGAGAGAFTLPDSGRSASTQDSVTAAPDEVASTLHSATAAPGGLAFATLAAAVAGEPQPAAPPPPPGGPGRRSCRLPPARLPAPAELAAAIAAAPVLAVPGRGEPPTTALRAGVSPHAAADPAQAASGSADPAAGSRGPDEPAHVTDTGASSMGASTRGAPGTGETVRDEQGARMPKPGESAAAPEVLERWWERFVAVRAAAEERLRGGSAPVGVGGVDDAVDPYPAAVDAPAVTPDPAAAPDPASADGRTPTPGGDALICAVLTASGLGRERGAPIAVAPRMAADVLAALPPTGAPLPRSQRGDGAAGVAAAAEVLLGDLADLGAVSCARAADTAADRSAVLTPLGWWLWFALLTCQGVRPRTHAELMSEDAEVLIDRAASGAPFGERELRQWIDARGPARALPELVEVHRRSDDCVHRALVNSVAADYALQARTSYEGLRTDPDFGGRARSWLFDAGFAKHDALEPHDHLGPLLDALAASLRTGTYGCAEGAGALSGVSDRELPAVFDTAAGCGHPESPFVLSWFARHHPDHRIRAAARAALPRARR